MHHHEAKKSSGRERFSTGVTFVFHRYVDAVGVTDKGERWQGAVDVHFAGDDING